MSLMDKYRKMARERQAKRLLRECATIFQNHVQHYATFDKMALRIDNFLRTSTGDSAND